MCRFTDALEANYGPDWPESEEFASDMLGMGLGNPGICLSCKEPQEGCEPDAAKYPCEGCGAREVYGVSEIALNCIL